MLERIKLLMEKKDLTASQFADGMEVPRAVVSHILSGRNKPSLDVVMKIASTYTDINLEWLLLGKGEMLTSLAVNSTGEKYPPDTLASEEKPVLTERASSDDTGKVQVSEPEALPPSSQVAGGKAIRQVMFFYTDGTFEAFQSGK